MILKMKVNSKEFLNFNSCLNVRILIGNSIVILIYMKELHQSILVEVVILNMYILRGTLNLTLNQLSKQVKDNQLTLHQ